MFLFFYWISVLKHSSFDNLKTSSHFSLNIRLVTRQKQLCAFIWPNWFTPYFNSRVLIHSVSILVHFQAAIWSESTIALSSTDTEEFVPHLLDTDAMNVDHAKTVIHNYQQALNSHMASQHDPLHTCNILADSYKSMSASLFSCHV